MSPEICVKFVNSSLNLPRKTCRCVTESPPQHILFCRYVTDEPLQDILFKSFVLELLIVEFLFCFDFSKLRISF